jgi:hypothetical protein
VAFAKVRSVSRRSCLKISSHHAKAIHRIDWVPHVKFTSWAILYHGRAPAVRTPFSRMLPRVIGGAGGEMLLAGYDFHECDRAVDGRPRAQPARWSATPTMAWRAAERCAPALSARYLASGPIERIQLTFGSTDAPGPVAGFGRSRTEGESP